MIDARDYASGADFGDIAPSFFLIGLISEFDNRFQTVGDGFFDGVSWKQVFLLNCVTFFKEPPSIRELSELLGSSHQNTKQLLSKLERNGFVELRRDTADRRKQRVVLTPRALAFRARYTAPSEAFMRRVFAAVDPRELQTAISVIMELHKSLKEIQEETT